MKLRTLSLLFRLEIFLSYYGSINYSKLRGNIAKNFDKVTHILQSPQSCEQEDFDSSNKFLHLIELTIEQR